MLDETPKASKDDDKGRGSNPTGGTEFEIFTRERLQNSLDNMVEEVTGLLDVDGSTALSLLVKYKWDKEALLESYFAGESQTPVEQKRFKVNYDLSFNEHLNSSNSL